MYSHVGLPSFLLLNLSALHVEALLTVGWYFVFGLSILTRQLSLPNRPARDGG